MTKVPEQFNIETFERHVYAGRLGEATHQLLLILNSIAGSSLGLGSKQTATEADARHHWLLRLACASTALLASPRLELSEKLFLVFMAHKRFLSAVFMSSDFADTTHLAVLAADRGADNQLCYSSAEAVRKLMLCLSLKSSWESFDFQDLICNKPSKLAVPFWITLLEAETVIGKAENQTRNRVALMEPRTDPGYIMTDEVWVKASNAWMLCSYIDSPHKHQPKKTLNRLIRDWGRGKGIDPPPVKRKPQTNGQKPILTILNESFKARHAMFRCHAPRIQSLREHFHTICISPEKEIDEAGAACFDETITFPENENIRKTAGRIIKTRPDLLYYPCLGMSPWTITMAQFRFAPIQFMSMGMPATSMAPEMDYAIVRDADPALHSEKLITGAPGKHVPFPGEYDFTKQDSALDGVLIGVNAKNYKINNRLIDACHKIREQASVPVHFWFFPNCAGITFEAFRRELQRHIEAECFPTSGYATYIDRLRRCDLVLNPFPFGNTNSIIDCAQIGLPFVCLNGPELHSRADLIYSRELGYPSFLRAETPDKYIKAAVRLIDDAELRNRIMAQISGENRVQRMFESGKEAASIPLGETIWHLYQLHQELKNESQHSYQIEELAARARAGGSY